MIQKSIQTASLVIIGILLIVFPNIVTVFPKLKIATILGFLVEVLAFTFWYIEDRINNLSIKFEGQIKGHISEMNLPRAMNWVYSRKTHWKCIRIMATSTREIEPLFSHCGFTADIVSLIIRQVTDEEIAADRRLLDFRSHTESLIGLWQEHQNRGRINTLRIHRFEFFPLEYHIMFEEEILILGLYTPQLSHYSQAYIQDPAILTSDSKDGSREIRKYVTRYEGLVKHVEQIPPWHEKIP